MPKSLQEAVDEICTTLPDNYQINICLENGAGWVELLDTRIAKVDQQESLSGSTFVEELEAALDKAKEKKQSAGIA